MRALVTGGGRGIGAGIARALASDGWDVVVAARRRAQVQSVASEIGGRWVEVDVSDRGSVERMVAEAGEVDLLVANAGVSEGHAPRPSWEIGLDEWWQVYEVNVLGVHLCCRALIPGMLERGRGRIVITGSGAAAWCRAGAPRVSVAMRRGRPASSLLGSSADYRPVATARWPAASCKPSTATARG